MHFQHSSELWQEFPQLVAGVLVTDGITAAASVDAPVARFSSLARARLSERPESELPEVQAWRRAFSQLGLKPTQYRSASESLLRRLRKEGSLPRIHPLIDLCNAVSLGFATPVAAFDVSRIAQHLEVRRAAGTETYDTFVGTVEHPSAGEVIFADRAGRAHARRWTNRQSGHSAVRDTTATVLIVAEALHEAAAEDIPRLLGALTDELAGCWSIPDPKPAILSRSSPRFDF